MRRIALLGSTGSIGTSALAVVGRHPERFHVEALAAHRSGAALLAQVERFSPSLAVLVDGDAFAALPARNAGVRWRSGREGLLEAAAHADVDVVLNAVVGAAGLEATVAALAAGKRLALANKESLVAGGPLVLDTLRRGGGELIPVDSEHSAILQCVAGRGDLPIRRLILTASGGPFRTWDADRLAGATPGDALRHPTWDMGAKITVDSATLVNKALEVIEAHWLFGVPYDRIEVVVHPQSIIHSMVEFADGSILAQMGFPTMELPILYALTHPDRVADDGTRFDPVAAGDLTFEAVDHSRFPAFELGVAAGRSGGTMPAVFNAANEVAVEAFLQGRLPYGGIPRLIEAVMTAHTPVEATSLGAISDADTDARARARAWLENPC